MVDERPARAAAWAFAASMAAGLNGSGIVGGGSGAGGGGMLMVGGLKRALNGLLLFRGAIFRRFWGAMTRRIAAWGVLLGANFRAKCPCPAQRLRRGHRI